MKNDKFKFLLISIIILTIQIAYADRAIAADFTMNDTKGNSHTLYNYLNSGKYVILNIISTG